MFKIMTTVADLLSSTYTTLAMDLATVQSYLATAYRETQALDRDFIEFQLKVREVEGVMRALQDRYIDERPSLFLELYLQHYLLPLEVPGEPGVINHKLYQCYKNELKDDEIILKTMAHMRAFVPVHCRDDACMVERVGKLLIKTCHHHNKDDDVTPYYKELEQFLAAFTDVSEYVFYTLAALVAKVQNMLYRYDIDVCRDDAAGFVPIAARYLVAYVKPVLASNPVDADKYYQDTAAIVQAIATCYNYERDSKLAAGQLYLLAHIAQCPCDCKCMDTMRVLYHLLNKTTEVVAAFYTLALRRVPSGVELVAPAWEVVRGMKINDQYIKYLLDCITTEMKRATLQESTLRDVLDILMELGKARIAFVDAEFLPKLKLSVDKSEFAVAATLKVLLA